MCNVDVFPGISDHEAIRFKLVNNIIKKEFKKRKVYFYSKGNFEKFRSDLKDTTLLETSNDNDVEHFWQFWKNAVLKVWDANVPHGYVRKGCSVQWINSEVKKIIKKRNRIFNKAKKSNKASHWEKYRQLRREVKKKIRSNYLHF